MAAMRARSTMRSWAIYSGLDSVYVFDCRVVEEEEGQDDDEEEEEEEEEEKEEEEGQDDDDEEEEEDAEEGHEEDKGPVDEVWYISSLRRWFVLFSFAVVADDQ